MLKIGHRGAPAYAPENTIKSFKKAIELGVDAIEFDVRQTKDKKIVVFHDEYLNRLTERHNRVRDLTLEQLKELEVDGEIIPSLEEALEFIDEKTAIVIEFKDGGLEEKVLEQIKKRGLEDDVVLICFSQKILKNIRSLSKDIDTGLIYKKPVAPVSTALNLKSDFLLVFYQFITRDLIKRAHARGLHIVAWVINNEQVALQYAQMGVDGIASDKPDILNKL